ncbi:hypothetical protein EYF80_016396 [Liparis tanakae]|uniref:Uncharacterized protein n=1 Tax=Liparis tanakae TaxID=230148 RepID=A0A4Z2I802_9TELE|nr:hypothetical protein EYF80_016396 [Liparis tanakae]
MQAATAVRQEDTVGSPRRVYYMHHLLRIAGSPGDLFGPDAAEEAATAHVFLLHLLVHFVGSKARLCNKAQSSPAGETDARLIQWTTRDAATRANRLDERSGKKSEGSLSPNAVTVATGPSADPLRPDAE